MAARVSEAQLGSLTEAARREAKRERAVATWALRGVRLDEGGVHVNGDTSLEATLEVEIERVGADRVVATAHVRAHGARVRTACVEARLGDGATWMRDPGAGMTHVDVAGLTRLSADERGGAGYGWTTLLAQLGVRGGRARLRRVAIERSAD